MKQRMHIKIAGKELEVYAYSAEMEEQIRIAANGVEKAVSSFHARYPTRGLEDILSFVSLNVSLSNITLQRKVKDMEAEVEQLQKDSDSYLDTI